MHVARLSTKTATLQGGACTLGQRPTSQQHTQNHPRNGPVRDAGARTHHVVGACHPLGSTATLPARQAFASPDKASASSLCMHVTAPPAPRLHISTITNAHREPTASSSSLPVVAACCWQHTLPPWQATAASPVGPWPLGTNQVGNFRARQPWINGLADVYKQQGLATKMRSAGCHKGQEPAVAFALP